MKLGEIKKEYGEARGVEGSGKQGLGMSARDKLRVEWEGNGEQKVWMTDMYRPHLTSWICVFPNNPQSGLPKIDSR